VRFFSEKNFGSVHPAVNEYPTLFRAAGGEGGEEEEWYPTSVAS